MCLLSEHIVSSEVEVDTEVEGNVWNWVDNISHYIMFIVERSEELQEDVEDGSYFVPLFLHTVEHYLSYRISDFSVNS